MLLTLTLTYASTTGVQPLYLNAEHIESFRATTPTSKQSHIQMISGCFYTVQESVDQVLGMLNPSPPALNPPPPAPEQPVQPPPVQPPAAATPTTPETPDVGTTAELPPAP